MKATTLNMGKATTFLNTTSFDLETRFIVAGSVGAMIPLDTPDTALKGEAGSARASAKASSMTVLLPDPAGEAFAAASSSKTAVNFSW